MDKKNSLLLALELLWWFITAMVVVAVLYPIQKAMHVWPFKVSNIVFIAVFLTLARYTFLLQHTFVARRQVLKIALMLLMFPLVFALIDGMHTFMNYVEERGWDTLTGHLPMGQKAAIERYIWNEMLFFGVGSIIAAPVFAGRLMMSIWRTRNRGTV